MTRNAYHGGFSRGYNSAKATNFAGFTWPEAGHLASTNWKIDRPWMQIVLPVKMLLCMKACNLCTLSKPKTAVTSYDEQLIRALFVYWILYYQKRKNDCFSL